MDCSDLLAPAAFSARRHLVDEESRTRLHRPLSDDDIRGSTQRAAYGHADDQKRLANGPSQAPNVNLQIRSLRHYKGCPVD